MWRDILKYIYIYNGLSYNGSTPDFGPGSPSSNLGSPTIKLLRTVYDTGDWVSS